MAMQELALNLKRIIPLWRHRKKSLFNNEFQKKIFGSRLDLQLIPLKNDLFFKN
jgi:hypothetical protein